MHKNLQILQDASARARYSAQRHQVIAENIANANTPGYKARDLEDFKSVYTDHRFDSRPIEWRAIADPGAAKASPNGNTVSLQQEMMRGAQAEGKHEAATLIYRKAIDILKMTLGR